MACPRCSKIHVRASEVQACHAEWLKRQSVDTLISRSSLGTPEAVALRKRADPAIVKRVLARADELESSRKEIPAGLEIAPGKHPKTGADGFFAYARKLIGNFPICWNPTRTAALVYGIEFINRAAEEQQRKGKK